MPPQPMTLTAYSATRAPIHVVNVNLMNALKPIEQDSFQVCFGGNLIAIH